MILSIIKTLAEAASLVIFSAFVLYGSVAFQGFNLIDALSFARLMP